MPGSGSHRFRVATACVRTLCDKGKSTAVTGSGALSGRAALLENEMARCGLDPVCIQEGRTQTDQIIEGAEYTMVVVGLCNNRCLNQSQTFEIASAAQKRMPRGLPRLGLVSSRTPAQPFEQFFFV